MTQAPLMRRVFSRIMPGLAVMIAAAPAWAESAAHGSDQLPQFRAEFFAGQIFWLAISFALFYLLLKHKALPRVDAVQNRRRGLRDTDLAAAAQAHDEARQLIAAYDKALADARAQGQARLQAIMQAAQQEAAAEAKQQQHDLDVRMHEAQARIEALRVQYLGQLRDSAADVAAALVAKLTGMQVKAHGAVDAVSRRAA